MSEGEVVLHRHPRLVAGAGAHRDYRPGGVRAGRHGADHLGSDRQEYPLRGDRLDLAGGWSAGLRCSRF